MTAHWFGYNPPFLGGTQQVLSRQEDERIIKNDLLQLIMTVPGERLHRPNFGTILKASIFEPFDAQTLMRIRQSIIEAIATHEPRVVGVRVFLETNKDTITKRHRSDDRGSLTVKITGSMTFDPNVKLSLETVIRAPGVIS
jgi:phage baseplate assembly protein W